jgi:hypothetical protein
LMLDDWGDHVRVVDETVLLGYPFLRVEVFVFPGKRGERGQG